MGAKGTSLDKYNECSPRETRVARKKDVFNGKISDAFTGSPAGSLYTLRATFMTIYMWKRTEIHARTKYIWKRAHSGQRAVLICPWVRLHAKLAENRHYGSIRTGTDGYGGVWQ